MSELWFCLDHFPILALAAYMQWRSVRACKIFSEYPGISEKYFLKKLLDGFIGTRKKLFALQNYGHGFHHVFKSMGQIL